MNEKGTISVHTENIFPIIKKFLYSDQDIFLRELVANAVDATQKLKKLVAMGKYEGSIDQLDIKITINEKLKKITITDQGLGMTADEIKQYINQIAFSGATAFVEKYKDQGDSQQLIGFFGLGFYAAFMVAKKVEIMTKSYQKNGVAAHWTCDGSTNFEINPGVKKEVGTSVVLHLAEDAEEFLKKERIAHILNKHCKFLPVPISFDGKVVNNTHPIWIKNPSELKDEDYLAFYKELYPFAAPPLFWIHLNIDYPFNLTGVLYFPKAPKYFESKEKIQLYAKQVFITDEVKNIVPDFLQLLHGVIDSPDIPLNVSRSALQADSNVKKINTYISKKVGEKLAALFKEDRASYEEKWEDIAVFIKYGMLTDDKFYEKAQDFALLKNIDNAYFTIQEYKDKVVDNQTDKDDNLVLLYTKSPEKQATYINICQNKGYDILVLATQIDDNFINLLEHKLDKVKIKGVDTDTIGQLIDKAATLTHSLSEEESKQLQEIYEQSTSTHKATWRVAAMAADELPVTLTTSEMLKRMQSMAPVRGQGDMPPMPLQAVINGNHPLAKKILENSDATEQTKLAEKAFHIALLAQGALEGGELATFIQRIMEDI